MRTINNPPAPGTPEWAQLVTASKMAGIVGLSPFSSPFSVWADMTTPPAPVEPTAAMKRGTYLENGLLDWFESDHPELTPVARQVAVTFDEPQAPGETPEAPRMLATLDGLYRDEDGALVVVEVKTASRDDHWRTETGGWQVPPYYEAQVRFQLALADQAAYAIVVVLTPFLGKEEIRVDRDPEVEDWLVGRAIEWLTALDSGQRPDLDDSVATYEAVRRLHPDIDPDGEAEVDAALAGEWLEALAAKEAATKRERGAKSRILDAAGRARTITAAGHTLARRQPGRGDTVTLRRVAKLDTYTK